MGEPRPTASLLAKSVSSSSGGNHEILARHLVHLGRDHISWLRSKRAAPDTLAVEATVAQRIFATLTASAPTATPRPRATSTATPTDVPATSTATIERPTDTPEPPTPTDTTEPATSTPEGPKAVVKSQALNVRAGPDTTHPIVASAQQGEALTVTGRNQDGSWLEVSITNGTAGWVSSSLVSTNVSTNNVGRSA